MKGPARDAYHQEQLAVGTAPAALDGFDADSELEEKLVADRWYVGPAILALTLAWVSNAVFRWPVSGLAGMLEAAAFAGLAAQQIESRKGIRRSLGVYVAWAALACIGATDLPADAVWLAAAPVVVVLLTRTQRPMLFILALPAALPWVQAPAPRWEIRAAQSVFMLVSVVVVTMVWRRSVETPFKRFWDRVAVASWIVLVLPSATAAGPALAVSVVGLLGAWALRRGFRERRSFLPVVLIWAGLHLLGLRAESGPLLLRLALIVPGFLLLVIAGWRFAAARRQTQAPCRILTSPLCFVPDLRRSQDYAVQIYVR